MRHERFEILLKQTVGLDINSIGPSAVTRAVERRSRACDINDPNIYWERISTDHAELQALIETVVVPETWFFRDREAFATTASLLSTEWQTQVVPRPFRLLSLPCSTGEEAYTLAIALMDAGLAPCTFRVDGIDISNRSLEKARLGVYGRNSFRGHDLAFRDRHFTAVGQDYRVSDAVRSSVHFSQGNIFALDQIPDGGFDVIYCRNLLIYFDEVDQTRAIAVLRRLLAPKGTLFVGHSEGAVLLGEGFESLRVPHAFGFRHRSAPRKTPLPVQRREVTKPKTVLPVVAKPAPKPPVAKSKPTAVAQATPPPSDGLEDIRRAANCGDMATAMALGRGLLDRGALTADGLHLIGVIHDAGGYAAAAADYYRKALYLDPHHRDAMAHLALLLEGMGDHGGARRIHDRARRIDERKDR